MARGWESKAVEDQVESVAAKPFRAGYPPRTPEQIARQKEREGLELSRTKILNDLEAATNPRHRESLEAALKHLEEKLAAIK
jgi:hypothetical protein